MDNIFNPVYRQDYLAGYTQGQNPFLTIRKLQMENPAFSTGFNYGRNDYERLNGAVSNGIPLRIVTDKVLEEFLLAGMLGLNVDADHYTPYQIETIEKWYQSGVEKYDPDQNIYLLALLEKNGIFTK